MPIPIIAAIASALVGIIGGLFLANRSSGLTMESYQTKADKKLSKAEAECQKIKEDAKEKVRHIKDHIRQDEKRSQEQQQKREALIVSKQEQVAKKEQIANEAQAKVDALNKKIDSIKEHNHKAKQDLTEKLSKKTGITTEKAKTMVIEETARDLELMREERLHKFEEYLQEDKMRLAKDILTSAIQRYSAPTSVEKKSLSVMVPRDELKGKVIGPQAEHLKLLEELTECEIIFNDAPNTIIISCLDLVKKHIARETIIKLIKTKNITPEVIKATIERVKEEMEKLLIKIGKETCKKLELDKRGTYPDEFYRIMGRLQFRTSYGQNIMKHSFEVGYFTLMLGAELGLNMETCRIAGFFHDLGKAIDHELNEPHDHLTKKIMEQFGFNHEETHAAWNHHDAIPHESSESMLVKAADAISAGRPGARQETLEKFLEHVRMIEDVGNSYEGVKKTFAISAGRELRILVEPAILEDEHLSELAKRVSEDIQEQKAYPGKIKVNVIRRTQNTEFIRKKSSNK